MELNSYLNKYKIIGVISNYNFSIDKNITVKELLSNSNIEKSLRLMELDNSILDKSFASLSLSEKTKVDILSKMNKDIIITGSFSNNLMYKDRESIKRILKKLSNSYNKKVIIIDDDISVLMNISNYYLVLKKNHIVYKTDDVYDDKLYTYVKMPEIISFVKKVQKKGIKMDNYTETYELIKAIYRSVS